MAVRALGAPAERKGRALVVEVLRVRESCLVLTLHVITLHISLPEASARQGWAGEKSGLFEHTARSNPFWVPI